MMIKTVKEYEDVIRAVKKRFYISLTGWALTGVYLWAHWYFDHKTH